MYVHTVTKSGEKVYLHKVLNGTKKLFFWFFSKNAQDALDLPPDLEVFESKRSGYPLVRKKRTGVQYER
jgi:hypothetical protein